MIRFLLYKCAVYIYIFTTYIVFSVLSIRTREKEKFRIFLFFFTNRVKAIEGSSIIWRRYRITFADISCHCQYYIQPRLFPFFFINFLFISVVVVALFLKYLFPAFLLCFTRYIYIYILFQFLINM